MPKSVAVRPAKRRAAGVPRGAGTVSAVPGKRAKAVAPSRRRGAPGGRPRHLSGRYVDIPVRVLSRLFFGLTVDPEGCFIPRGPFKADGYKHCYWTDDTGIDRTLTAAHLVARVFLAEGRTLRDDDVPHHTCHNPPCVNPNHLKIVSREEHARIHGRS